MIELESAKYLKNSDDYSQVDDSDEPTRQPDEHPRAYVHKKCNSVTYMPLGIQKNYLADPYYYGSDTICCQCGEVSDETCYWVETGESVHSYMQRLKKNKPTSYHIVRWLIPIFMMIFLHTSVITSMIQKGDAVTTGHIIFGAVLCFGIVWYPAKFLRLALCRMGFA